MRRRGAIEKTGTAISSGRFRSIEIVLVFVMTFLTLQTDLRAQQPAKGDWTGKWVIPKRDDYQLRDPAGNLVFGEGQFDIYLVQKTEGKRLWLGRGTLSGWIDADQVVAADSAVLYFSGAIKNNPRDWYAYAARGAVRQRSGGNPDEVIADFTAAIGLRSREPNLYYFRGYWHNVKRSYDKAIADFNHAIRLAPNHGLFFYYRGEVWIAKKDYENAIADFNDAIRLNPQYAQAYNGRAWLLATCPSAKERNGKRAVESAVEACKLTNWNDHMLIDTLAAAHAEAGDFDSAVKWQARAISLSKDEPQKTEYRARLKLYQNKKAYHQEEAK